MNFNKIKEDAVQILANLYEEGLPPEAYEDAVGTVLTLVRAEMLKKKTLRNGVWVDAETGEPEKPVSKLAEMLAFREAPAGRVAGRLAEDGKRNYDLPSASQIRNLEKEDAKRYPLCKDAVLKAEADLRSGKLKVHDAAIRPEEMGKRMVRVPSTGGSEMLVPVHRVPESEIRRLEAIADARDAERDGQFREAPDVAPLPGGGSVQVGLPRPVAVPAWEKPVSYSDVLNGPSMPKPV